MNFAESFTHPDIISLVIGILLMLLTIPLFMGKGGFLIAGWNSAPAEEKKKYDEKKMCRCMAIGLLILGILTLGLSVMQKLLWYIILYLVLVLAITVFMIWYIRTRCRKESHDEQ